MLMRQLKTERDIASIKISEQIRKGTNLYERGIGIIKDGGSNSRILIDSFVSEYRQWVDFTSAILLELFESPKYSREFRSKHSTDVKYVDSSWIPDIEYYVEKELIPKIEYLRVLGKNIGEFDEGVIRKEGGIEITNSVHINRVCEDSIEEDSIEVDKVSIIKLLSMLNIHHIIGIISLILAIIIGSFEFGYHVSSWKVDKQKYELSQENARLNNELKICRSKIAPILNDDSRANSNGISNKNKANLEE